MEQDVLIRRTEAEIDRSFASSELPVIGYAQAVWTLLSVNEDAFLMALRDASGEHDMHIFTDVRLNALSHPLRVCLKRAKKKRSRLRDVLIDDHYKLAWNWISA